MPALIAIDSRGIASIEIEDAGGECRSYSVRRIPPGLARWAVELTRLDSTDCYRVAVYRGGLWRCECPAWRYRKSAEHPRGCKHVSALEPLYRFLLALWETPANEQQSDHRQHREGATGAVRPA